MMSVPYRFIFFVAALLALGIVASALTVPFNFSSGGVIKSEEVNANFAAVTNAVDEIAGTIPGAGSASAPLFLTSFSTVTEVASIEVNVPADGYVDLASSGWINLHHTNGNTTEVWVALVEDLSDTGIQEGMAVFRTPSALPSSTYQTPYGLSRLFPATAGTHTFHLIARRAMGSDGADIGQPSLRAVYYPTSYATVASLGTLGVGSVEGLSTTSD